jgi:hypothetical protein
MAGLRIERKIREIGHDRRDLGGEGDFGFDLELAPRFFGVAVADHQERRLAFLNSDQTRLFVGAGRAGQDRQALPSFVGLRGLRQRSEQLRLTELGRVLTGVEREHVDGATVLADREHLPRLVINHDAFEALELAVVFAKGGLHGWHIAPRRGNRPQHTGLVIDDQKSVLAGDEGHCRLLGDVGAVAIDDLPHRLDPRRSSLADEDLEREQPIYGEAAIVILKEPFEELALLVADALAGRFPELEDMVEADPVRQEFDSSLEIGRAHSGDSLMGTCFFGDRISRRASFSPRKVRADRLSRPLRCTPLRGWLSKSIGSVDPGQRDGEAWRKSSRYSQKRATKKCGRMSRRHRLDARVDAPLPVKDASDAKLGRREAKED